MRTENSRAHSHALESLTVCAISVLCCLIVAVVAYVAVQQVFSAIGAQLIGGR